MIPIQKLLNRIRWDKEFGNGSFEVGYEDHIEQRIVRIPFRKVRFCEEDPLSFHVTDAEGVARTIPFHRIREVFRDGALIWQRHPGLRGPD
jgi:uncharacterized protein (UPF0248 family)